VVVGMGLNLYLDQENLPQKLRSIAGALYETKEDAEQTDRNKLTAMIVNELRKETADLKLSPDYVTHNMIPGHQITIADGNSSRQAFALEICRDGRLKVREEDGQETILSFGEVSVSM
jgi:BirA family biotin operon repressor/biotin-[acetyl-CoA-carboxylase] ligase